MKLSFLGVGHWHATMHGEAALAAGAGIASAWDPEPEAAAGFAQKFGCPVAPSLQAALEHADLAVVMGRPFEIVERGLQVIAAEVPLLLEKPVGISADATDALIAAAQRKAAFVAMALPHGMAMMAALGDLDAAGRRGPISHSHFRLINGPPQRYVDDGVAWVLDPAIGGGGALRNLGIHGINAFLMLAAGQEVEIASASFGRPLHGTKVEDYAAIVLRAADGMLGLIEAGYTFASMKRGLFEWRVSAANATLSDFGDRLALATLDDEKQTDLPATPIARRYHDVMADTLQRLAEGRPPAVSLADARRAMAIIDRCYALERA
ncbi:Gfo/Idh/MocA family protein [Aminobacter aminovorans]|uniref:Dehydrogenase n=1 Tax=Aminobacter aminovorans TaxID=83263 RepID=A0AAC9ASE2_AMIAI|nr:Gfo/Idh/MocA family oxidoreductase [Aminobacter aminovorans]AMS43276.1 Oxidoreductase [Aminobacter aminovorans]MBB3706173.1 putative dehydrogenase [Aminobacter aminovorans]